MKESFAAITHGHAHRIPTPTLDRNRHRIGRLGCAQRAAELVGGHDDAAIIREAERGERIALGACEEALDGMLPPTARELIEQHCAEVRHSHNRVHALLVQ